MQEPMTRLPTKMQMTVILQMSRIRQVITGAFAPVLAVHEDYANRHIKADFAATVSFGEGALNSNYSLSDSDNTASVFSIGKEHQLLHGLLLLTLSFTMLQLGLTN